MSKMFYNYNGCSVNIYSIGVDVKRLIMIRETIIKRCSQYNHTVYEVKGYPNMMDKSKKYLSVTDTGKKERVKIDNEWYSDEIDSIACIYLVDVIEYIEPIIIKVIDDILGGNYDNVFDIYRLSCSKNEYIDFENNKLNNLNNQCALINMFTNQNKKELMIQLNNLKKDLKLILENINKNKNIIFASSFATQIDGTIKIELIESVPIEEFNKSSINKLTRKLGNNK